MVELTFVVVCCVLFTVVCSLRLICLFYVGYVTFRFFFIVLDVRPGI